MQFEFQLLTSTMCIIILVNQRNEKAYEAMRIQGNSLSRSASLSIEAYFHNVEVKLRTATYLKFSYVTTVINSRSNSC